MNANLRGFYTDATTEELKTVVRQSGEWLTPEGKGIADYCVTHEFIVVDGIEYHNMTKHTCQFWVNDTHFMYIAPSGTLAYSSWAGFVGLGGVKENVKYIVEDEYYDAFIAVRPDVLPASTYSSITIKES